MNKIEFQLPTSHHKTAAEDFKNEFFEMDKGEKKIPGSAKLLEREYGSWLNHTINNRQEDAENKDGGVVRNTFFAVRKCDNKIIGIIDIRHSLGDDTYLNEYGGHIGYSVRPSERKKGYATEMLKMGLEYAKSLNIEKVMIGCYSDNQQSIKTIEKCGGVLSDTKLYTDGKPMNIYDILITTK